MLRGRQVRWRADTGRVREEKETKREPLEGAVAVHTGCSVWSDSGADVETGTLTYAYVLFFTPQFAGQYWERIA